MPRRRLPTRPPAVSARMLCALLRVAGRRVLIRMLPLLAAPHRPASPSPSPSLPAVDTPPPGLFSCSQQKTWGLCDALASTGFCAVSCGRCTPDADNSPCDDIPTPDAVPCSQARCRAELRCVHPALRRPALPVLLACRAVPRWPCHPRCSLPSADRIERQVQQPVRAAGRLLPRLVRRLPGRRCGRRAVGLRRPAHPRRRDVHRASGCLACC